MSEVYYILCSHAFVFVWRVCLTGRAECEMMTSSEDKLECLLQSAEETHTVRNNGSTVGKLTPPTPPPSPPLHLRHPPLPPLFCPAVTHNLARAQMEACNST